jgi:signal transduction histidine kinase
VAEEQLRFARDLKDLLGREPVRHRGEGRAGPPVVSTSPTKAKTELAEITGVAQRRLADVRSVVSGYWGLSLEGESRMAQSLLAASDVDVRIHLDPGGLPAQVRPVLATVLREGVGAVLRHTAVEHC